MSTPRGAGRERHREGASSRGRLVQWMICRKPSSFPTVESHGTDEDRVYPVHGRSGQGLEIVVRGMCGELQRGRFGHAPFSPLANLQRDSRRQPRCVLACKKISWLLYEGIIDRMHRLKLYPQGVGCSVLALRVGKRLVDHAFLGGVERMKFAPR